jgi:hypothetical protein
MAHDCDFSRQELDLVEGALADLARHAPEGTAGITLRREPFLVKQGQAHPTVMGVFLPGRRCAVLYDPAFAGRESVLPLDAREAVGAVLAPALLRDPDRRAQWFALCGADPAAPPAAAILEAASVARVLAAGGRGERLPLASLPTEAAFGLAYALHARRRDRLVEARPDVAAFFGGPLFAPRSPDQLGQIAARGLRA